MYVCPAVAAGWTVFPNTLVEFDSAWSVSERRFWWGWGGCFGSEPKQITSPPNRPTVQSSMFQTRFLGGNMKTHKLVLHLQPGGRQRPTVALCHLYPLDQGSKRLPTHGWGRPEPGKPEYMWRGTSPDALAVIYVADNIKPSSLLTDDGTYLLTCWALCRPSFFTLSYVLFIDPNLQKDCCLFIFPNISGSV